MSSVKQAHSHSKTHFAKLFAPIASEIEQVNCRLKEELRSHIPFIDISISMHSGWAEKDYALPYSF